jgi:D-alanyl-D-alanine carboxypeptidase (penicillin-binding protein 5/6)
MVLAICIALLCAPVTAKDDVMILRLEDEAPKSADSAPRETVKSDAPAQTGQQVREAPPCADKCAPKPQIPAISAVLMDADTGQVIYAKNPHLRRPNASTTKIMTAILLIENCGMSRVLTASKKASETPYTSLHLKPGEQISARDLLMGMMIRSANDAAVVAAEHVGGSVSKFAAMMNCKAREIGCKNTNFVTPNGLAAKGHYSSAYDLCLIARHALKYDVFNEAVNTRKWFLNSRTINREDLAVFSKSKFMKGYAGADGVKSGYVREAGYCYVGSATRDGWRLVSAVLRSDNSSRDTAVIMDYVFGNYKPFTVARAATACAHAEVRGGSRAAVPAAPTKDLRVAVPKTGATVTTKCEFRDLEAPVPPGVKVGTMTAFVDGREAATVDLRATEEVGISIACRLWSWTKMGGIVALCLMMGRKYGNAFTKSARRRRRRVTSPLRSFDRWG